jgi:hypothetical protein
MIADMRPDVRIILHRDRDFQIEPEMQFELATAAAERQRNNVTRVVEVFTPLNDVEHSFAQASHLKEVFADIGPALIDAAVTDVTALRRDELVNAARLARQQVKSSLYDVPRKRSKVEWDASGMPDVMPSMNDFIPANGLVAVSFEHTHGKILMNGLRPRIHHHVGGSSQASDDRIFTATSHLETPSWLEAFSHLANE